MKPKNYARPLVQRLHPYVPGEQPKIAGLIKLNTNENPYPPSPKVLRAVKAATDDRLRLYPDPTAQPLREKLAELHRVRAEKVVVGNGSDELLALAVRAFVEPGQANGVQYFAPSYSLYPVLADTHGAKTNAVPLNADFTVPDLKKNWDRKAPLSFVTSPNAPSGRAIETSRLREICAAQRGVVVIDEAYVDFAKDNGMALATEFSNVLVSRTFSKAFSLCFQRVGYMVGHPLLIEALDKLRDSYNVNGLGQVAALATLEDLEYYRKNFARIIATREQFTRELMLLGFDVLPSAANFIFAKPPRFTAEQWLAKLRENNVLVRWFKSPETRDFLRITIGSEREMKITLQTIRFLLTER
jgi:histidinol-phosphate aminotransferase